MYLDISIHMGVLFLFLNVLFMNHNTKIKHYINYDKLDVPLDKPLTVSEAQSRSIIYRNSLTFIWCLMGFTLTYKKYLLADDYFMLHYSLPLLSVFPLKANTDREICIFVEIDSRLCNLMHYIIVVCYITLYPLYRVVFHNVIIYGVILILFLFLYFLIQFKYQHTLLIETFIMGVITVIFTHW